MPFLNALIKESMRINGPSVSTIPRLSSTTIQLGPYTIPPNTPILLNTYGVMHNRLSWKEPDEFTPSRWLTGQSDDLEAAWMPFGAGPRRCPASNFSLCEQRTLVSLLLREYKWSLPHDSAHRHGLMNGFSAFALNLPKDLHVQFHRLGGKDGALSNLIFTALSPDLGLPETIFDIFRDGLILQSSIGFSIPYRNSVDHISLHFF